MLQEIKLNNTRIGVLIGKGGATKKEIEEKTGTQIHIDSEEGLATVEGDDTDKLLRAVQVINAINRGFSPERSFCLLDDEDLLLDIIDLSLVIENPRQLDRIRGRIIGKDGRAREQLEDMTDTEISIFGKTVAIIGLPEQIKPVKTAIEMLIQGIPHETVFSFLEKKRREAKKDMISYYY